MKSLALGTAALAFAGLAFAAGDEPPVGQQAKLFNATDVFNMRVYDMRPTKSPLKALRGRAVLFMMFETWYDQCKEGVDDINALNDKYGPKGLTILACGAQEKKLIDPFIAEKGVRFSWCLIDTPTQEQFKRDWPFAAMPHAFLIDAYGKIVWQGHPRMIPKGTIEPYLGGATQPPILAKALSTLQAQLDGGQWAEVKKQLDMTFAEAKLEKRDLGWCKDLSAWIEERRAKAVEDAESLCKKGMWWDGWKLLDEFPTRFAGMDGADAAKAKADEIRKNPEAEKDLKVGDDVLKARELVIKKNWTPARMILVRLIKEGKGTRHGDRAQDLMDLVPPK
jgi:hypothetical protein